MMKTQLIFYFHGYNSGPTSDKVDRLKSVFPDTYAFKIDPDPDVSLPYLQDQIDLILLDAKYMHHPNLEIIFIGTSLGGWYAAELADRYKAKAVLINPCYDPSYILKNLGCKERISSKYPPMKWLNDATYYIAKNDEVIDFRPVMNLLSQLKTHLIDNANHRFNGPEFDKVIKDMNSNAI